MIGTVSGVRVVFSSNQFGRFAGEVPRPWPNPPAHVNAIPPSSSGVDVDWILKDGSGFGYTYGPFSGPDAPLYVAVLFGFKPSSKFPLIGGKFYNASIRPYLYSKIP